MKPKVPLCIYSVKKVTIPTIVHIFKEPNAYMYWELTEAHICLGRHQETKCLEKCNSIVIHIRVICQYWIALNWNAVRCCACAGMTLTLCRKVHNVGIPKNTKNVQYLIPRLYRVSQKKRGLLLKMLSLLHL